MPLIRGIWYPESLVKNPPKSKETIPKSLDKALDKANPAAKNAAPGISIRNGPVDMMDVDPPHMNGTNGKRKARNSTGVGKTYKEASDSEEEDEKPLVRLLEYTTLKDAGR